MTCPTCGYVLSDLDSACPRCSNADQPKAPGPPTPPPAAPAPQPPAGRAIAPVEQRLQPCGSCGNPLALDAEQCPHCGTRLTSNNRYLAFVTLSFLGWVLILSVISTALQRYVPGMFCGFICGGGLVSLALAFATASWLKRLMTSRGTW